MLESFYVFDKDKHIGMLDYNTETKSFKLRLYYNMTIKEAPLSIEHFIRNPTKDISESETLEWLMDRVISPNRMDIDEVLRESCLKEYDLFEILKKSLGVCPQDKIWISLNPDKDRVFLKNILIW